MPTLHDPNYHLGHLIIDTLRRRPNAICQIDAWRDEEETNASVLSRSIRLAKCFTKLNLKPGDVLAFGGRNHIDLHIPYYAALINGLPIVGVDPIFKYDEIKSLFKVTLPKIAFCDKVFHKIYQKVIMDLDLDTILFTYDGDNSMAELLSTYDDGESIENFEPPIYDLDKIYAWLVSSGGTTGVLKLSAFKHKTCIQKIIGIYKNIVQKADELNAPPRNGLNLSPVQWLTGYYNALALPFMNRPKLQTSGPSTAEHIIEVINKYKPATGLLYPSLATTLLKYDNEYDLKSFELLVVTGGKFFKDYLIELRKKTSSEYVVCEIYGQTETLGPILQPNPMGPLGNCGKKTDDMLVKLIDPETGKEITEPGVPGELWTKGPCFTEYYKDPKETADAFSEDGWFKTGDILYRDEKNNFFFVERLKMLIKYRNYQIIPPELEEVILTLNGVKDVSVTSIPDLDDGEHPVACVVKEQRSTISAQEIKDIVANKLSDSKRLRGGVIFLDCLPLTSAGKVARGKLRQMVQHLHRE